RPGERLTRSTRRFAVPPRRPYREEVGTAPGHLGPATPGRRAWGTVRRRWRTGPAWTGAAILLAVVVLVLWWWWAREQTITAAPGASWAILVSDLAVALAVGVVIGVGATVLALVVRRPLPVPFLIVFVASALVLVRAGPGPSLLGWLVLCVLILAGTPLLGGLLSSLIGARAGDHRMGPGRIASGGAAAGALGIVVALLAWTGTGAPDLVT